MRDENNFMFSEKFLLNYADSLKLLRALGDKNVREVTALADKLVITIFLWSFFEGLTLLGKLLVLLYTDENNFIFSEKFLFHYADNLKLLRALEDKMYAKLQHLRTN